jgi:hypothetical protein
MIHSNFLRISFSLNNRSEYSATLEEFPQRDEGSLAADSSKNLVLYRISPA